MRKILFTTLATVLTLQFLQAQIINGQDTLYGNEWIHFDQSYFKILVAEDGIYRLTAQTMTDAGIPMSEAQGNRLQLFHNGEEVPVYVTTDGIFGAADYLEFFGQKNTSELDRHLFLNPDEEMMNPRYSLFTDTAAYFLTWPAAASPKHYQTVGNDLVNLPGKEPYFTGEHVLNYFSHFRKKQNSQGVSSSDFGVTEGFSTNFANSQTFSIAPVAVFLGGPDGELYIRYSANNGQHLQQITLNNELLLTDEFFDYQLRQLTFPVPNATIAAGAMSLKFQGTVSNSDNQRVSNIILKYPRQFNFGNQTKFQFEIDASAGVRYLEIENFNLTAGTPILYDLTNGLRLTATVEGSLVKIALPPSPVKRKLILVNDNSGITAVATLKAAGFIDYKDLDAEFIFLTNPRLYDDGNGNNWVQEYANYRSSATGGGYSTVIVDVQQLYDQFGWGLNRHSLSIRNFGHFVKKHWTDVKYFFVVGKGREYPNVRTAAQLANAGNASFYVPTFGMPGSDNLLIASNYSSIPIIPIGRIASTEPDEISIFLKKIIDAEDNHNAPQEFAEREWMKRVLHLGGGGAAERDLIKGLLEQMETEIETNQFGGKVTSFYKTSNDPIQISRSEQIFDLINSGVSIINFFGHSGANTFDFSLDSPDNYENQGKYPLFLSLGCYSGQIHGNFQGVSERFLFVEEKGAIGFIASSSLGYISALSELCGEFYRQLGGDQYGSGIGKVLQKAIEITEAKGLTGGTRELVQQFTLHGDPAYVLNAFPGPDYVIDPNSVLFDPQKISVELDSFEFSFVAKNIGKNILDSVVVEIRRDLPSGINVLVLQDTIAAPANALTLKYSLPTYGEDGFGENRFYVEIDATDRVEELPGPAAEANNKLIGPDGAQGVRFFFSSNDIRPVYPKEFAIVGTAPVTLKASTANTFAELRNYLIQIDTTEQFNSTLRKDFAVEMIGGVLKWQPDIALQDSTVYYWRVSPDSVDASGYNWKSSSFVYLEGAPNGWSQSHYFQFKKDKFVDMELTEARRWKFLSDFKDVKITQGEYPSIRPAISINNTPASYLPWDIPLRGGVMVTVLDSVTVAPWRNLPVSTSAPWDGLYGSYNIPPWIAGVEYFAFPYETRNEAGRQRAMTFLDSIIPPGNYVVLITVQESGYSYEPEEWAADSIANNGKNLFNLLEAQGATMIRQSEVTGAVPYYFVYKKDDASFEPQEGFLPLDEISTRNFGLLGTWDNGRIETNVIGPARKWDSFYWEIDELDPITDEVFVNIFGQKQDGTTDLLFTESTVNHISLSGVDAAVYPDLKISFVAADTTFLNPPQLNAWRVFYEGGYELALNPAGYFSLYNDTLQQGEVLKLKIAIENLGEQPFDSVEMKYTLSNGNNNLPPFEIQEPALLIGDTLIAEFTYLTDSIFGKYQIIMEANPKGQPKEEVYFNNVGISDFYIEQDVRNPLLDVYFDGIKILNGDLVSSKPLIKIELEDENSFLPLNDTSLVKVFLQYPDDTELKPLYFASENVDFFPATVQYGKNSASIEIRASFEKDGNYQLIVQAKDVTGNNSGSNDFKVAFEVITASTVSNVLNYPNPFSTSTRFLYTLTGSEPPAHYKIQIMTVSGRIVKEITQEELGELKPGRHLTDYVWDGRDEYGDKLANGVYLYRFVAQDSDGNEWGKYDDGTNQYFKSGIGKMVIIN
jgi:hypothetical protein